MKRNRERKKKNHKKCFESSLFISAIGVMTLVFFKKMTIVGVGLCYTGLKIAVDSVKDVIGNIT